MLPLALLQAAQGKPMLVELKNGETFNGHLTGCDNFMNLTMKEVYQTSAEGTQFWKLPECYVRGSTIKYVRVADSVMEQVKQQEDARRAENRANRAGGGRGAPGGGPRGGAPGGRGRGGDGRGRGGPGRGARGGDRGRGRG